MTRPGEAIVAKQGDGPTYWTGFPNTIRITGEQSGGAYTLIELRLPPGYTGAPHIHRNEDQIDHVVQGEVVFTVGEETIVAQVGSVIHCPKDVPHSFSNRSDEVAVIYDWLMPAGFEEFMARAAPLLEDPDNPPEADMERAMKLAPEYGLEFLPPDNDRAVEAD